ncbi:MAG: ParB/RepB/Spo0J family partition protein [Syntrophus sp. (in: bacteria)]
MATIYVKGKIYKLPLAVLQTDPSQARKFIDPNSLNEMKASIQEHGVLQPILFRQDEQAALFIVAGERRVAAAKAIGMTIIPGLYRPDNYQEVSLTENLLRENLTPVEEAEALAAVMKEKGYNQQQLSEKIGKSQPIISQTLSINNLPLEIRDQCRSNPNVSKRVLMNIAQLKSEQAMRNKFKKYMDKENKPVVTDRPPQLSKAAAFIGRTNNFHEEIVNLAWQDWSEDEKADLANCMRDLRRGTDDLLQALGGTDNEGESSPTTNRPNLA